MKSSWEPVRTDSGVMRVYMCVPEEAGPFPGVVVIHNQGGIGDILHIADQIAGAGYVTAAPDMYYRDGTGCQDAAPTRRARLQDATVIQDVNATVNFLSGRKELKRESLGILGFCMGGRVTYLMAAANPAFKAAVLYYGGGIFKPWGDGASPFDQTAAIHCPLMGHFGEEDENPSPQDVRELDGELARHHKPHEFYSYRGAGHAFMNKSRDTYRQHAAEASWPRTLEFFAKHLGA